MDLLRHYRELRSMGLGDSRAKASAAIEYARSKPDMTVKAAQQELEHLIKVAAERPTRSGGTL